SFRVVNQSPWLLFSPAENGIIKFFDPSRGKFYFDETPELKRTFILCSKDGWILFSLFGGGPFLYNPFTLSKIDLPCYSIYPHFSVKFALSCASTSPDSVVFAIGPTEGLRSPGVSIGIFHPGDAKWTTVKYQNTDVALFHCGDGPVFFNGLFYCLSEFSDNLVGIFDPQKHTWSILPVPPPNHPHLSYGKDRAKHIVEFNGEPLLVCVSYPDKPIIFKLDLTQMKWVEMESLNGVTVFVSSQSSLSAIDVPKISRNSIYFSKPRCYGKSSNLYSLDDCSFHPVKQHHKEPSFPKTIWIKPPKMSHLLFEELY
ncbi:F-box/kelch-repeat protein At1g57790-like, partial [Macadamia integrifolia]|uniref:F-box/kelch-repeat protein At1g57790-like n=1 Tax=Macadamia integrifolia TaxID=60698 RepID=UPI001C4E3577